LLLERYLENVDDEGENVAEEEHDDDTEEHHGQSDLSLLVPLNAICYKSAKKIS
jgi:hypothetical protein